MQFWFYLFKVYIYWVALENAWPTLCDTVDPRKTITADFSQSNTRKFRHNAGKQCIAMFLMWYDHRQPMAGTRSVVLICFIQHTLLCSRLLSSSLTLKADGSF